MHTGTKPFTFGDVLLNCVAKIRIITFGGKKEAHVCLEETKLNDGMLAASCLLQEGPVQFHKTVRKEHYVEIRKH